MSQLLQSKIPSRIYQDFVFTKTKIVVNTLANEARCYVCSKGLEDGHSVTAKNTTFGKLLFCDKHYFANQTMGVVIAPCAADPTKEAYFANAPDVQFGFGLDH